MANFKPQLPYTTSIELLIPTYKSIKGVRKKVYPENGEIINCSFKTYGGTEKTENGIYSVLDTANVETWYRPDITSECAIKLCQSGAVYEIKGNPENIDMRNQYLKFKVERVEGGV